MKQTAAAARIPETYAAPDYVQHKKLQAWVREIAQLLFWEATQDLQVESYTVTTPLAECSANPPPWGSGPTSRYGSRT